jgi:hypothetical protein
MLVIRFAHVLGRDAFGREVLTVPPQARSTPKTGAPWT